MLLFYAVGAFGQAIPGSVELGMRSTTSVFGVAGFTGTGVGGQFRIGLMKKLNTEWFADWITTNVGSLAKRTDAHIGWSVMFYPFNYKQGDKFIPYIMAGHCFDYTKIRPYNVGNIDYADSAKQRWSSAVQAGIGAQYWLTKKFNITLSTQYMVHLGNDIDTDIENGELHLTEHKNLSLEGHLLVSLSFNIKFIRLWKKD